MHIIVRLMKVNSNTKIVCMEVVSKMLVDVFKQHSLDKVTTTKY